MSTTSIPNTSAFPTMPAFPSIRSQADTTSVTQSPSQEVMPIIPSMLNTFGAVGSTSTATGFAPRGNGSYPPTPTTLPELNRIYFNKKKLADTYRELHTKSGPTILHIWEIPFSCDADTPVTELTRRIDAAMAKTDSYQGWTIDYSQFIIKAVEK